MEQQTWGSSRSFNFIPVEKNHDKLLTCPFKITSKIKEELKVDNKRNLKKAEEAEYEKVFFHLTKKTLF